MSLDLRNTQNASRALSEIRKLIASGDLPRDGRLPTERDLSDSLGISRRSVRSAFEALEAEGLIWRRQGKGTFVGQPPDPTGALAAEIADETDIMAVMEARLAIEPALAALCARRATADDVERLRHLVERTLASDDADTAELWDGALHRLIARIAGNRILMTAFALLDEVRMGEDWQDRRHRARSPETKALYDAQHREIVDAVERRDSAAAHAAMTGHLKALIHNLEHRAGGSSDD